MSWTRYCAPVFGPSDCRELLVLWRAEPDAPAAETALAGGLLAQACLDAGDNAEAEALAQRAGEALGPWQHPDAASCLITLARWQAARQWTPAQVAKALRLIETAPLLSPAGKARFLGAEARRPDRHGRTEEAQTPRSAIPPQWRMLAGAAAAS